MEIYLQVIKEAIFYFPIIALLFTLPYVLYNYHKFGSVLSPRVLVIYSFILYLMCIYFLVILPLPSREEVAAMTGPRMQLIPLGCIRDMIKEAHNASGLKATLLNKALLQVLLNIVMCIPFGIYLRYYFRCNLRKTLLLSFLLSVFFELTQLSGLYFIYPRSYRLFDVDDLWANTLGGFCGYYVVQPFLRFLPSRDSMDRGSFLRGQRVSMGRRLMAAVIDFPCVALLSAVLSLLVPPLPGFRKATVIMCIVLTILSIVFKGQSLGKLLTQLKIVRTDGEKAHWHQLLLRYVWMLLLPSLSPLLTPLLAVFLHGMLILLCISQTIMHKPLFYEQLSGTQIISTINVTDNVHSLS